MPLIIAATLVTLSGCGSANSGSSTPPSPQKSPTIAELTAALDACFDAEGMHSLDESRVLDTLGLDATDLTGFVMKVPVGTNMDEYGVFIAADGKSQAVTNAVVAYITARQESWMDEYLPDERPKIFEAEMHSALNYVFYVMAFKDVRANATAAFQDATS
jgi:hypothetical protein